MAYGSPTIGTGMAAGTRVELHGPELGETQGCGTHSGHIGLAAFLESGVTIGLSSGHRGTDPTLRTAKARLPSSVSGVLQARNREPASRCCSEAINRYELDQNNTLSESDTGDRKNRSKEPEVAATRFI